MIITNGLHGGITIADVARHEGSFQVLKALGTDVVFLNVQGNVTGLDGTTLSNGDFIPGHFTSITLTSGVLIAYHEPKPDA